MVLQTNRSQNPGTGCKYQGYSDLNIRSHYRRLWLWHKLNMQLKLSENSDVIFGLRRQNRNELS